MKPLKEYVALTIPRSVVVQAIGELQALEREGGIGLLAELQTELVDSLIRDRHREAVERIQHVLGDLGSGDLLPAIADAVERHPTTVADYICEIRHVVNTADEKLLMSIGDGLGLGTPEPGELAESYRARVLARLGARHFGG